MPTSTSRLLSELDLNDVFSINIESKESAEGPEYDLKLVEWSPFFIDMRFKFETPALVSRGATLDKISIDIKKPELFVSKVSNEPLVTKSNDDEPK